MLDRVELLPKMSENLRLLWPYRHKREQGLMLLCEEIVAEKAHFRRTMQFNYVVKMPPMNKMVRIVGMSGKEKITAIQELSLNLGVMKE